MNKTARDALEYLALLVALAIVIVVVIHPWLAYFVNGLPSHWDPPTDAAHICWNAHSILHGSVLRPDYDSNHFYPHAYTMAFSEPMWPPSFFSAIIYGLTRNPMLTWNATALFVWALSGVTMYAFLRELPVSRGVGYVGAALFCLIPYRLAYYVELNMILCFAIPLTYLFLLRWLRRLGWVDALLLAVSVWIAAATCLYYTIIMLVPMPFILIAFLIRRPEMLRQRRFYLTAAAAVCTAAVLCVVTLSPYLVLRYAAQYTRTVAQQARSSIQPLTFLRPSKASLIHRFAAKAEPGETVVFPGITLLALACLYWIRRRVIVRRWRGTPPLARVRQGLGYARGVLWFVFAALVVYGAYHTHTSSFASVKFLVVPAVSLVFWISLAMLFMPAARDVSGPRAFLAGLAVGAVACFILSFGPRVTLGHGHDIVEVGAGPAASLHKIIPLFSLTRVMTRFTIIVLLFMIVGGCVALDGLLRKLPRRLGWLWVIPLVLVVVETYSRPYEFADQRARFDAPVQRYLRELPQTVSLVQIPYGLRDFDGPAMMATVGRWHYLINGWCGFMPKQHRTLGGYLSSDQMKEAADWLRQIWPEAYLLVDREGVEWWHRRMGATFTESDLEPYWQEVKPGERFGLYRLKPLDATPARVVRRLRTDVLRRHPRLRFEARAVEIPDGATAQVHVRVNEHDVETVPLTDELQTFLVPIPRNVTGNIWGEEVTLSLEFVFPDRVEQPDRAGLWGVRNLDFVEE
jgi:hypothetical protein